MCHHALILFSAAQQIVLAAFSCINEHRSLDMVGQITKQADFVINYQSSSIACLPSTNFLSFPPLLLPSYTTPSLTLSLGRLPEHTTIETHSSGSAQCRRKNIKLQQHLKVIAPFLPLPSSLPSRAFLRTSACPPYLALYSLQGAAEQVSGKVSPYGCGPLHARSWPSPDQADPPKYHIPTTEGPGKDEGVPPTNASWC